MSKILSAKYCQENKKKTTKNAPKRYQNLSKEEKEKYQLHGNSCKNLSEDEKQKLVEDRKKSYRMKKMLYHNHKKLLLKNIMT